MKTYKIAFTKDELEALNKGKRSSSDRAWLTANQKLLVAHTESQTKQPNAVFDNTKDAFKHFLDHIYPTLPKHTKAKLKDARYDFLTRHSITLNKMEGILADYASITKEIIF